MAMEVDLPVQRSRVLRGDDQPWERKPVRQRRHGPRPHTHRPREPVPPDDMARPRSGVPERVREAARGPLEPFAEQSTAALDFTLDGRSVLDVEGEVRVAVGPDGDIEVLQPSELVDGQRPGQGRTL